MEREQLGEVTAPSGALLVVDLAMLGLWAHDRPPLLPKWAAPPETLAIANAAEDHRVEGPDALRAAAIFGRQPPYLYDRPPGFELAFADKVGAARFDATLVPLPERVTHLARLQRVLASERRGGVVEFHGMWALAAGGLPKDRAFEVSGTRMETGDYPTNWRDVEIHVRPDLPVRATDPAGEVIVLKERLAILDAGALGAWQHPASALIERIRESPTESATLDLAGARIFAMMTMWGNGCFPVERDLGPDGELVALRIILGSDLP